MTRGRGNCRHIHLCILRSIYYHRALFRQLRGVAKRVCTGMTTGNNAGSVSGSAPTIYVMPSTSCAVCRGTAWLHYQYSLGTERRGSWYGIKKRRDMHRIMLAHVFSLRCKEIPVQNHPFPISLFASPPPRLFNSGISIRQAETTPRKETTEFPCERYKIAKAQMQHNESSTPPPPPPFPFRSPCHGSPRPRRRVVFLRTATAGKGLQLSGRERQPRLLPTCP